jgi:hypothetical protein
MCGWCNGFELASPYCLVLNNATTHKTQFYRDAFEVARR